METPDKAFYNPLIKYNYLTPEQRRKKREILERKGISISDKTQYDRNQIMKTVVKKSKPKKIVKAKDKLRKKKLFSDELIKPMLTDISQSSLVSINSKHNKFFKNRSPDHLRKVSKKETIYFKSFIKKSRLNFDIKRTLPPILPPKVNNSSFSEERMDQAETCTGNIDPNTSLESCSSSIIPSLQRNDVNTSLESCSSSILPFLESEDDVNTSVDSCSSGILPILETSENVYRLKDSVKRCISDTDKECCNLSEQLLKDSCNVQNDKRSILIEIQGSFMKDSDEFELSKSYSQTNESKSEIVSNLDSEKTSATVKEVETDLESSKSSTTSQKFYPLFYKKMEKKERQIIPKSSNNKRPFTTKDTSKGCEQMIIDAGQKEFGTKQCKTCNMIYTIGQAEDENLHSKYHDKYLINLKFPGWKEERLIRWYNDGRIIKVLEDDKNFKLKKIKDILCIANRDLGFSTTEFPVRPNVNFFIFISNDKKVRGLLVAESITCASPVILGESSTQNQMEGGNKVIWKLGDWYASSESVPAICGINRIWVAKEYRRHKVASRLLDCLRQSFFFGYVLSLKEMAFTDPTPDGREFAAHYTGTDNFLVYK